MTSIDIIIEQEELTTGVARHDCPFCARALVIRLPKHVPPGSPAVRLQMVDLTPGQRDVFDELYASYPLAIDRADLGWSLGLSQPALREQRWRMAAKLLRYGWRIQSHNGTLCLVAER